MTTKYRQQVSSIALRLMPEIYRLIAFCWKVRSVVAALASLILLAGIGQSHGLASPSGDDRGETGSNAQASIIGGKPASISSYPWLAHISYRGAVEGFDCGGTVVSPRLILTAAHCVLTGTGRVAAAPSFSILTGTGDLREAAPERVSQVSQVLVFPEYEPSRTLNDAALLVLAAPVTAPTLPLATTADEALLASGAPLAVAGWGLTSFDPPRLPAVLREGQSIVQSSQSCQRRLRQVLLAYVPGSQFCVKSQSGSGVSLCNGDSGGPGIARRPDGSPVQVGVISLKASLDCNPASPQIFARVDRVSPWVAAWTAAVEHGAPAPAVVVPEIELPRVTRRDAEVIAWLGLEADLGNRFSRGRLYEIGCVQINREKVKCRVQWLKGRHLYRGGITIFAALPREGSIYNYRYKIRRFGLVCWLTYKYPIQACSSTLIRR